jgi:hypothetical protein
VYRVPVVFGKKIKIPKGTKSSCYPVEKVCPIISREEFYIIINSDIAKSQPILARKIFQAAGIFPCCHGLISTGLLEFTINAIS